MFNCKETLRVNLLTFSMFPSMLWVDGHNCTYKQHIWLKSLYYLFFTHSPHQLIAWLYQCFWILSFLVLYFEKCFSYHFMTVCLFSGSRIFHQPTLSLFSALSEPGDLNSPFQTPPNFGTIRNEFFNFSWPISRNSSHTTSWWCI